MSDCLRPHGLQHTRLLCPLLSPGVCSNSCPLSQWCCLTISSSAASFPFAFSLSQHQGLFLMGSCPWTWVSWVWTWNWVDLWVWFRPDKGQVRVRDGVGHVRIWNVDEHTLGALTNHVIGGLELSASCSFSILTFWERRGAGVQLPNRQWFNQSSPCNEASIKNLNGGFWRASRLVNCGGFVRGREQRGCGLFGPSHTSCSLCLFHLIVPDLHPLK